MRIPSARRFSPILAAVVVAAVLCCSCGPAAATVRITLKGEGGGALPGITVTCGEAAATTDSGGRATLKEIAPGQVTLVFSGGGYDAERTATVRAGVNDLSYQLEPAGFSARAFSEIERMRIRVRQSDDHGAATEGVFVRGKGVHWVMADGSEVISTGDVVYVKLHGQVWQRIQTGVAGQLLAEAIAEMGNQMFGEIQAFDARVVEGDTVRAEPVGSDQANGYDCRVFEVGWESDHQSGEYTVHVIAQGEYRGFVTRYTWEISGDGVVLMIFDVYDFNGEYDVCAPI